MVRTKDTTQRKAVGAKILSKTLVSSPTSTSKGSSSSSKANRKSSKKTTYQWTPCTQPKPEWQKSATDFYPKVDAEERERQEAKVMEEMRESRLLEVSDECQWEHEEGAVTPPKDVIDRVLREAGLSPSKVDGPVFQHEPGRVCVGGRVYGNSADSESDDEDFRARAEGSGSAGAGCSSGMMAAADESDSSNEEENGEEEEEKREKEENVKTGASGSDSDEDEDKRKARRKALAKGKRPAVNRRPIKAAKTSRAPRKNCISSDDESD